MSHPLFLGSHAPLPWELPFWEFLRFHLLTGVLDALSSPPLVAKG